MAVKQGARIGKTYLGINPQLTINSLRLSSQNIDEWKKAIDSTRSATMPRRRLLLELYDSVKLDGHLTAVMQKRIRNITNKKVLFQEKGNEGVPNDFIQENVLETPWFNKLLEYSMEQVSFGHSLIELIPDKGLISKVELINRYNVFPEYGALTFSYAATPTGFPFQDQISNQTQIAYRSDPRYINYLLEVGDPKDYGLLMVASQYVIYKRGGFGNWSQFAELFGMPFRIGKYSPFDDASRRKLEEALIEMGGAAHIVIPDGTSIEFKDNNGTGKSEIFKDLVHECNSELSKIFLGQTMTTDNGSSRSQSEVHKDVEEEITLSDMIKLEYLLNWDFKRKLQAIGYQVDKGGFFFKQTQEISLDKRIEMDVQLADLVPMDEEYFYKTYGIPKPDGKGTVVKVKTNNQDLSGAAPEKKKIKNPQNRIDIICCAHDHTTFAVPVFEYSLSSDEEQLINAIYNKDGVKYDRASFIKNIDTLKEGLSKGGLGTDKQYGEEDYQAATMMEVNLNRFGFNKNLAQVYELNQALKQTDNFNDFKTKASGILGTYNKAYLETEYNLAIATAQNAANWIRQKAQQNTFPYLQYQTAGDSRVRPPHADLDGKIFKVNDSSWAGIYPPNGFGCRCEMIQIPADDVSSDDISDGADAKAALGDEWNKMQEGGFAVNRGETKEVFDLNKTYISQLEGAENIDPEKLTYKDAGLKPYEELRGEAAIGRESKATPEKLLKQFDKNQVEINGKQVNLYPDYAGRQLAISRKDLSGHLSGKYIGPKEERDKIFGNVSSALKDPDEVYFRQLGKNTYQYRYMKFFNDNMFIVDTEIGKDQSINIKTWYKGTAPEEQLRKGIVIKSR